MCCFLLWWCRQSSHVSSKLITWHLSFLFIQIIRLHICHSESTISKRECKDTKVSYFDILPINLFMYYYYYYYCCCCLEEHTAFQICEVETLACVCHYSVTLLPFSVSFRKLLFYCKFLRSSLLVIRDVRTDVSCCPMLQIWRVLLEYPYSSSDIVLSMVKILFHQKFEVIFGFVIYSLYLSIRVYKANMFVEFSVISVRRELF